MKIIEQSITFEEELDGEAIIRKIENAARTCYRSEHAVKDFGAACSFVSSLVRRGHDSTLEHVSVSARVVTNRSISHQWVRHRVGCSYSQESTRYCNYGGEKFGAELTVIWPWWLGEMPADPHKLGRYSFDTLSEEATTDAYIWYAAMKSAEQYYKQLIKRGRKPDEARGVLAHDLKTEFVVTMSLRAWRHFLHLRCAAAAHPQIRHLACSAYLHLSKSIPVIFDDLDVR